MAKTVYPDWVQRYRKKGMTVKKKDNGYYLYRRTSRRVPGKKNPQVVEEYQGVITPEGLVRPKRLILQDDVHCMVKEYGFTKAVLLLCPESWKRVIKDEWNDVLKEEILKESPFSYLSLTYQKKGADSFQCNLTSQYRNLIKRFKELGPECSLHDLDPLKEIYLVRIGSHEILTDINEEQQEVLDKYGLEVADNEIRIRSR